ncbi:hypothetical protein [Desulfotruncus alcoholivorax]|uniref:hypothetical protein n=1 Tax=Desulfotruncus alcoholivorax TaxID=265477 RepID=UPI00146FB6EB|nr:hypothetical protein [Desulfotruncus alcoholivorax]
MVRRMCKNPENSYNSEEDFTCGEFVQELLRETKCGYEVVYDPQSVKGLCHYKKKEIILTYLPETRTLWPLFQAGHEIGHAYYGPDFLFRYRALLLPVIPVLFLVPVCLGLTNQPTIHAFLFTICACVFFLLGCYEIFSSEVKASLFALEKLKSRVKTQKAVDKLTKRLKLDIWYNALEIPAWFTVFTSSLWFFYLAARYFSQKAGGAL